MGSSIRCSLDREVCWIQERADHRGNHKSESICIAVACMPRTGTKSENSTIWGSRLDNSGRPILPGWMDRRALTARSAAQCLVPTITLTPLSRPSSAGRPFSILNAMHKRPCWYPFDCCGLALSDLNSSSSPSLTSPPPYSPRNVVLHLAEVDLY
jgi:hypothetical protein